MQVCNLLPLFLSLAITTAATSPADQHGLGHGDERAPACWPGKEIHDPCDGFETGCTVDGILVVCDGDPQVGDMIFSNDCPINGSTFGGCVCTDGIAHCNGTDDTPKDPECWPGKQIHDPCDGFETGCTVGGILVACDGNPATGNMIFRNDCPINGSLYGGCVCTDGDAHCQESGGVPGKCWPGKEIHDPCDGYETGCTVDGIMVTCDGDPNTGAMVVDEHCPTTAKCVCVGGIATCEEGTDKYFLGGEL